MLSPRIPDLAALQVLAAVAATGSLNAAAAEVGVSQQAVSSRISSIESQTGVVLVNRTPRGSTLTPAGVLVVEWASRLLDSAAELDAGLASLTESRRRRLKVSASMSIAEQLLPGWLVSLNAHMAVSGRTAVEVVLTATSSEIVAAHVRQGRADVGFLEGGSALAGLRGRTVGRDRLQLVVGPDHPWSRRHRPVTPQELARTSLVTTEAGSGTRDALDSALLTALGPDHPIAPPVLALSTTSAVRAAVIAGAGAAVLSELAVADDLLSGRLRSVRTEGLALERVLRAVWRGTATPPAGAGAELVALAAARARQTAVRGSGHRSGS